MTSSSIRNDAEDDYDLMLRTSKLYKQDLQKTDF